MTANHQPKQKPSFKDEPNIEVLIEAKEWGKHPDLEAQLKQLLQAMVAKLCDKPAGLTLLLSNNQNVQELNKRFRKIDKATDVLSFQSSNADAEDASDSCFSGLYLGDIIIAYEYSHQHALENRLDFKAHIIRLAAHGMLHLLGHDHQDDDEANKMQQAEEYWLKLFAQSQANLPTNLPITQRVT